MSHLRVLIADNDTVVRRCLRTVLGEQAGIEVVGEAREGDELLNLIHTLKPDRVLLDVRMPNSGGLE
nr:response regulator transcription factor [Armatimonadota bacterium]